MQAQENRKRIEEKAYDLWVQAGRPDGHALDYWLQAERELSAGDAAPRARKPRAKRAAGGAAESLASPKVTSIKQGRSSARK